MSNVRSNYGKWCHLLRERKKKRAVSIHWTLPFFRSVLLTRSLNLFNDCFEGLRMIHCQIGKYFPVQLDVVYLELVHETRVRHSLLAGSGVDTGNPKAAEGPLFIPAIPVSVL